MAFLERKKNIPLKIFCSNYVITVKLAITFKLHFEKEFHQNTL